MRIATNYRLGVVLLVAALSLPALTSCRRELTSESFRSPAVTYRSIPFWSLNDCLDASEMRRQLGLMKEGGQGGAFLHSRIGLLTPYLSEEWFDLMDAGVGKCDEEGLEAWFYDEDKWPSGFAGGIVPLADQAFRSRQLARVPRDAEVDPEDTVLFQDDEYKYICHVAKLGMSAYNGTCWVDLMNPDMVRFFIECSYAPYVERFSDRKSVRGIFTDEPQVKATRVPCPGADAQIPYSPFMEDRFRESWGYDLDPVLPSLTDTVGNWRVHRLHYYRTVAACLEEAYSKQVGDYCRDNGFVWTGHYNGENTPSMNVVHEGNLMQQLRHMEQPGCDALGLQLQTFHNAKVTTSVANQYGRKRRLVEIFGISGHNLSFEDRMWIAGWHTFCGLNFMCPHLSLYSMKGERKRDYPPTISFQQPYWQDNGLFEDYSARLCYFATAGRTAGEVCVVSPLESDFIVHSFLSKDDNDENDFSVWDRELENTMLSIAEAHLNFDIADEQIMSEDASVSGRGFRIGEMTYQAVVVPPMLTIRPGTIDLLERFAQMGGKVIVVDSCPCLVEGETDTTSLGRLARASAQVRSQDLCEVLKDICKQKFTLAGEGEKAVYTHLRDVDGGHSVQLFNSSRTETARLEFRPLEKGPVRMLDPISGETLKVPAGGDGSAGIVLAPASSVVLTFGGIGRGLRASGTYRPAMPGVEVAVVDGTWDGRRLDPNSLPLDFAEFSVDGGVTWGEEEPVLAFYKRSGQEERYDGPLRLRYRFLAETVPAVCSLAVEQPWMYDEILVNGSRLSFGSSDWFKDPVIRSADIAPLLREGVNQVELSLEYSSPVPDARDARTRYGTEIETIYLTGDFGVFAEKSGEQPTSTWRNLQPGIAPKPMPTRLRNGSVRIGKEAADVAGDLVDDGYPFYAGRFELHIGLDAGKLEESASYSIRFPGAETIVLGGRLNGKELPRVFSSPWEIDVTDALKPGMNDLVVLLTGSLRNLMGPYHHAGGELGRVGPGSFTGEDDWLCLTPGDRNWYDLRRTGSAALWRDDYFCVPFGLLQAPVLVKR